jgi:Tfp pilus assembly protein PilZ
MVGWEGLNRRQFPRINYPCLIVIRNGGDEDEDERNNTILTHTDNVGVGGVCVSLKQNLKMFSLVMLELDLLDLGDHISCNGKVVWNVQQQGEFENKSQLYDVGIEFLDIQEKDRVRLKNVVERLVKNNV